MALLTEVSARLTGSMRGWREDVGRVLTGTSRVLPAVALNYQSEGRMLQLNRAKFSANGNCGYVLKPQSMCQGEAPGGPGTRAGLPRDRGRPRRQGHLAGHPGTQCKDLRG